MKQQLDTKQTIFVIDGHSLLYRAYYSMNPLHTTDGIPVHAVYNFCRMIRKIIKNFSPQYLVLTWDSPGKTKRHNLYPAYKAHRQKPPSDLFDQKSLIKRFANLLNIKQVEIAGIEADDIMFSIAQEQREKKQTVVLITSDKDMSQALDGKYIVRFDPYKDQWIDETLFEELQGFSSTKLPFYFALLGDTSDNIPGVRGIGKKTASELVKKFKSLEDLYANIESISKSRTKKALLENKDNAFLSRELFLLAYTPTKLSKQDFTFNIDNWQKARSLFEELNFKSLTKEIEQQFENKKSNNSTPNIKEKLSRYFFKTITTKQDLLELAHALQKTKKFALDTETTSTDPLNTTLVGISVAYDKQSAYYIPLCHKTDSVQLSWRDVKEVFQPILEEEAIHKYLHNAKFDSLVLSSYGISLKGIVFDSLIAARLICKDWQRIGLKHLSEYFLNEQMISFDEIVTNPGLENFSYVDLDIATKYAGGDALQTFRLQSVLQAKLKEEQLEQLYNNIEHPLIHILCDMEREGISIDISHLQTIRQQISIAINAIEKEIHNALGPKYQNLNLQSPRQIEQLLFYELQLPPQKKNKRGGSYSTDHTVLKALAPFHAVPALLAKHRELVKLKTSYLDTLEKHIHPISKKLHTHYNQTNVATGRLASSNPNLQNIPTEHPEHSISIRKSFKAPAGHVFISADYSQIELRVLAHIAKDIALQNAFIDGKDIHTHTAKQLFNVSSGRVTAQQRQIAKRINFSILYGLSPYSLAKDLQIPFKQAKEYIDTFFSSYPAVQQWMNQVTEFAKNHGYVETLWGRKRYVPAIQEQNKVLYEEAKRIAINTVIQGTAAEIIKQSMIRLHNKIKTKKLSSKIILQIHDELIFSTPHEKLDQAKKIIQETMEKIVNWSIPLRVSIRTGTNWGTITK